MKKENEWNYELLTDLFQVLANPIRLRILHFLLTECCKHIENGCSVSDIFTQLDIPQPYISKHLKILKDAGILDYERQGNRILYSFSNDCSLREVMSFMNQFDCS